MSYSINCILSFWGCESSELVNCVVTAEDDYKQLLLRPPLYAKIIGLGLWVSFKSAFGWGWNSKMIEKGKEKVKDGVIFEYSLFVFPKYEETRNENVLYIGDFEFHMQTCLFRLVVKCSCPGSSTSETL